MHKIFGLPGDRNLLLASLSKELHELLDPHLDMVKLEQKTSLELPQEEIARVIFPVSCVGSMVATGAPNRRIEVGLFGFDGMSGTSIVTGAGTSPLETFVQVPGYGYAIEAEVLRGLLETHHPLRAHFMRYVHCLSIQTTQTALCNGQAKLEERLARWLLMCHDRIPTDRLEITHEFMAVMLGVRRAGVTVGTHYLEGKGLIRAERGVITIRDRDGLESEARGSYGVPEREYVRLFGKVGTIR